MPWRETRDPYRIWVSEIMLQQTTVRAVDPFYRNFVKLFPTVADLAAADGDAVLSAWEGLGYYARARNLHAAARIVAVRHGGRLPSAARELSALPGVGRTTAGAIASIAFGRDEPVLDANVRRVTARLVAARGDTRKAAVEARLWDVSRSLILPGRGRDTALAMMDIGATVCLPRRPRCAACPLSPWCAARAEGAENGIPERKRKHSLPHRDYAAVVVRDGAGRVLIARRSADGLLGGLWEFPGGPVGPGEKPLEALRRILRDRGKVVAAGFRELTVVPHSFSHFRMTLHAFIARKARAATEQPEGWRWVGEKALGGYAFPSAHRKVMAVVKAQTSIGRRFGK